MKTFFRTIFLVFLVACVCTVIFFVWYKFVRDNMKKTSKEEKVAVYLPSQIEIIPEGKKSDFFAFVAETPMVNSLKYIQMELNKKFIYSIAIVDYPKYISDKITLCYYGVSDDKSKVYARKTIVLPHVSTGSFWTEYYTAGVDVDRYQLVVKRKQRVDDLVFCMGSILVILTFVVGSMIDDKICELFPEK